MNLDLEDDIQNCPSTQVFGSACRLSFEQKVIQKKNYIYLKNHRKPTTKIACIKDNYIL